MTRFVSNEAIMPENRLYVRGIFVAGFTSMISLEMVWMYTYSRPALLSVESVRVSRLWCTISGLNEIVVIAT
jgi:hypothetical protein